MLERPEDLHPHRLVEEHGAARTLLPDLSGAEPTQEGVRGLAFFQHRVETEGNIFGTARGFLAWNQGIVNQTADLWVEEATRESAGLRMGKAPDAFTDKLHQLRPAIGKQVFRCLQAVKIQCEKLWGERRGHGTIVVG